MSVVVPTPAAGQLAPKLQCPARRLQGRAYTTRPLRQLNACSPTNLHIRSACTSLFSSRSCMPCKLVCRAAGDGKAEDPSLDATSSSSGSKESQNSNITASIGLGIIFLVLVGYIAVLSPDQTPARDAYFVQKAINLITDPYQLPPVWWSLFNIMGLYPILYSFLIVPTGRSSNNVPAWPFLVASFGLGVFSLLPFFILWQPQPAAAPPAVQEEESVSKTILGTAAPLALLLAAVGLWVNALTAGGAAWGEFLRLFDESRFTHVMTIDFLTCTILLPFWMWNDAQVRGWEPRDKVLPVLSALPVVGPALYLVMRPKNY